MDKRHRGFAALQRRWLLLPALAGLLPAALAQQAPPGLVVVRTGAGCELLLQDKEAAEMSAQRMRWDWEGACVGGRAQGPGTMTLNAADGNFRVAMRTLVHAGLAFGYRVNTSTSRLPEGVPAMPAQPQSVGFIHAGQAVSFTDGWGLSTQGLAGDQLQMPLPQRVALRPVEYAALRSGRRMLMLLPSPCIIHPKVAGCADNPERKVYQLTETLFGDSPRAQQRQSTDCPDPLSLPSCTALMEQRAAPLRDEILAFLAAARPEHEARVQRMRETLSQAAATPPATTTPAVAPVAARSDAATPAPAADLEQLGVGALFALADEAQARGDRPGARAALRALLRRFPSHALAERAAALLPTLRDP